ncbi:type II 3-dehydroquinate dehydratase [Bacillus licheniformis]|uniref:3-dehydroquinate dehydratase n=5 Tax=Bacillus subtilis group TaxID=653685 RepID=AROQ_BACLD|nr:MULTISPECIES: type II 3-dehydroquinate dehydratase [Bacillus]Q65HH2.1 RecName: Full=3-dehydroquinate dehydratase; Short=3-dehydroquinase; AltName: Full=Type II DHQase [Bacillus licheniformis DSM 13 = ATCC 14580]MBJ7883780.1 type II 3-dehydroquinate dehydratase [Bacillaceae bacterium HSR45]MBY8347163.1 type II 3-dehydroquinate dehydratase [Bacillus sp. PCH94]MDP4080360.1 type II 3-dehydroquinate dehydratase [Bacillota bacterium]AAU24133.1 3-dehydroquinate dehydratase YqhS [Bacillus lichenifo
MPHILILNGPNLNRLGKREPDVYGTDTLTDLEQRLFQFAEGIQTELTFFQSNHEGDLIDALHEAEEQYDGIVLNPGAFSHYSYALRDAVAAISIPVIEVHLSNPHAREEFRHRSVIAPVARGQITGLGFEGYKLAISYFMNTNNK